MNWNELKVGADTGAVGGMFTGLKEGADLGQLFANTGSINQQTIAREQKLPWELAQSAADVDTKVMANDTTRATQSGAIAATNATNKTAVMTQEQLQQLLPFQTFNKLMTDQTQQSASMLTKAAERLERGDTSVWTELKDMADKQGPQAQKIFQETYAKFGKAPPAIAAKEARDWANKLLADLDNLDPEMRFKRWKETLEHQARMLAAKNSGSTTQPNWQLQRAKQVAAALKQNPAYSKLSNEQLLALAWKQIATQEKTQQIGDVTLGNNQTSGIEAYPEQGTPAPGKPAPIKLK